MATFTCNDCPSMKSSNDTSCLRTNGRKLEGICYCVPEPPDGSFLRNTPRRASPSRPFRDRRLRATLWARQMGSWRSFGLFAVLDAGRAMGAAARPAAAHVESSVIHLKCSPGACPAVAGATLSRFSCHESVGLLPVVVPRFASSKLGMPSPGYPVLPSHPRPVSSWATRPLEASRPASAALRRGGSSLDIIVT